MQRPCQDITPGTLTRQTKIDDIKLKQMTSLTELALRYFARDIKQLSKSPIIFYSFFKMRF